MRTHDTRRLLLVLALAGLSLFGQRAARGQSPAPPTAPGPLSSEERRHLLQSLQERESLYDPKERLLTKHLGDAYDYNTHLRNQPAHPPRDSLAYAADLLDAGGADRRDRAMQVIERVLELQDKDPASRSRGVWPHYAEEPLSKAPYVDYNWADFLGVQLCRILKGHRQELPEALRDQAEDSLALACASIRKRNVSPGYTNIAIMGTFVTLVGGELLGDQGLKQYGLDRLRRFVEHTRSNGGTFSEYNSPTYTQIALLELARIRQHAAGPEVSTLVEEVYRAAWDELSSHYHAPSGQWAGPHSRAYGDLAGESLAMLLEAGTGGKAGTGAPAIRPSGIAVDCPAEFLPRIIHPALPAVVRKTYRPGERPIVGTTYLHPSYALGTINRQDLWNQRRNLIAHFGKRSEPSYVRLRFLHDGYDLTCARSWIQQDKGRALVAVTLATAGGVKHPNLDPLKNSTLQTGDLRLRIELGGRAAATELPQAPAALGQSLRIQADGLAIDLACPFARLDGQEAHWEIGGDENEKWADIVLYQGPVRALRLDRVAEACAVLAFQISEKAPAPPDAIAAVEEGILTAQWEGLRISVPTRPLNPKEIAAVPLAGD